MREQRLFHPLHHDAAIGPQRVLLQENFVFGRVAVTCLQPDPFDEFARSWIFDLGFVFGKLRHAIFFDRFDGGADVGDVIGRWRIIVGRLQSGVEFGDVGLFARERRGFRAICYSRCRTFSCCECRIDERAHA